LYQCPHDGSDTINGTIYYVYEIFSMTFYPLTPEGAADDEVELQKILWSPASYDSYNNVMNSNSNNNNKVLPSSRNRTKQPIDKNKITQAIAFIHDYDIFYKPKIHSELVIRVTSNGELSLGAFDDTFYGTARPN